MVQDICIWLFSDIRTDWCRSELAVRCLQLMSILWHCYQIHSAATNVSRTLHDNGIMRLGCLILVSVLLTLLWDCCKMSDVSFTVMPWHACIARQCYLTVVRYVHHVMFLWRCMRRINMSKCQNNAMRYLNQMTSCRLIARRYLVTPGLDTTTRRTSWLSGNSTWNSNTKITTIIIIIIIII